VSRERLDNLIAKECLRVKDLLVWRLPYPEARSALCAYTDDLPNPIIVGNRVCVSIFSRGRAGAFRVADVETGSLIAHHDLDDLVSSGPVRCGQVAFVKGERLYAFYIPTGELIGTFTVRDSFISSILAEVDQKIIVGASCGLVVCLDAMNGNRLWSYRTKRSEDGRIHGRGCLSGNLIVFGTNAKQAYALDTDSGQREWSKHLDGWTTGKFVTGAALLTSSEEAVGLDPQTGEEVFRWPWLAMEPGYNVTASSKLIFTQLRRHELTPFPSPEVKNMKYQESWTVALEPDGAESWRIGLPAYSGVQLRWDKATGYLYESTYQGLGIVDVDLGVRKWLISGFGRKFDFEFNQVSRPFVTRKYIYILSHDGTLFCLRHPC